MISDREAYLLAAGYQGLGLGKRAAYRLLLPYMSADGAETVLARVYVWEEQRQMIVAANDTHGRALSAVRGGEGVGA